MSRSWRSAGHAPELRHNAPQVSGYQVTVGRELLQEWTPIDQVWPDGPEWPEGTLRQSGKRGEAVVRDRLHSRLSAPRRIGCSYQLTMLSTASGFDVWDWLPGDLMTKFFSDANDPSPE